jgi:hypothetical protein
MDSWPGAPYALARTEVFRGEPMILVGQYDSTFVRRVAATLNINGVARRPHPALDQHCARCEAIAPFRAAPYSALEAQRSGWAAEGG